MGQGGRRSGTADLRGEAHRKHDLPSTTPVMVDLEQFKSIEKTAQAEVAMRWRRSRTRRRPWCRSSQRSHVTSHVYCHL
jgi:hypothetical protein